MLALVDPALAGHVAGVHDFRVAARSLRAALRTLSRRPDTALVRRTKRTLRAAIRCLADVRDRDVGRSLILRLASGPAIDPSLKRRILGLAESDRRVALAQAAAVWPRKLDRELIALLDRGEPGVEAVIRRTRAEGWRQRRRAIDLIDALGRRFDPVRLHALRRRVRGLRYAIEVLAEVDSAAHARVIQLKPLQGALGDAQDRIVLSRWLLAHSTRFRRNDRALARGLRAQATAFRAQSMKAHANFLRLRPKGVLEKLALHVDGSVISAGPGRISGSPRRSRPRGRVRDLHLRPTAGAPEGRAFRGSRRGPAFRRPP